MKLEDMSEQVELRNAITLEIAKVLKDYMFPRRFAARIRKQRAGLFEIVFIDRVNGNERLAINTMLQAVVLIPKQAHMGTRRVNLHDPEAYEKVALEAKRILRALNRKLPKVSRKRYKHRLLQRDR
jgi:hypothetical protein